MDLSNSIHFDENAMGLLGGGEGLLWKLITKVLGGIPQTLESAFKIGEKDIPVCHTRIVREARGFPWNSQVGVHPLKNGHLEITRIKPKE
jgi:hypothetical protein